MNVRLVVLGHGGSSRSRRAVRARSRCAPRRRSRRAGRRSQVNNNADAGRERVRHARTARTRSCGRSAANSSATVPVQGFAPGSTVSLKAVTVDGCADLLARNVVLERNVRISASVSSAGRSGRGQAPVATTPWKGYLYGRSSAAAGCCVALGVLPFVRIGCRRTDAPRAQSEPHEDSPGLAQKRIPAGHRSGRELAGPAWSPPQHHHRHRHAVHRRRRSRSTRWGTSRPAGWFLGADRAVRRARRHRRAPLEQELDVRRLSRLDARSCRRRRAARRPGGVLRAESRSTTTCRWWWCAWPGSSARI